MDNWKGFLVMLRDEVPGIGAGMRRVEVTIGRKWAFVRAAHSVKGAKRRKYRMTVNQWNALGAVPFEPITEGLTE